MDLTKLGSSLQYSDIILNSSNVKKAFQNRTDKPIDWCVGVKKLLNIITLMSAV
jgi:hypothetical protein